MERRITFRHQGAVGLLVALPLLVLLVAACGGMKSGAASTTSGVAGTSVSKQSQTVTVAESEYKLALSTSTLHPGSYTFLVTNRGHLSHSLEINGPGITDTRVPGTIAPGKSESLTVTLQKGTYELFCPVPGHKQLGMDTRVTVGGGATTPTPSQTPAATSTSSGGSAWG
jgi:uncharacterized cupredoxin-like copper-binding protein